MRFFSSQISRSNAAVSCCVIAILFLSLPNAEARRSRHRSPTVFSIALQPFSLVHSVVHATAFPVLHNAHRVLRATALAPIKVAFYAPRRIKARAPRAERIEDDELGGGAEPIRVAYPISRTPDAAPRAEADDDYNQEQADPQIESRGDRPTVEGSRAVVRNGIAYAPSRAPQNVKNAIWAVNTLRRKPYVWGGGHGSFNDYGYDCSGTVSFALHGAGLISAPMPSSDLMRYGERGRGRWITVYSRPGHTFAVIAGLRLDTTDFRRGGNDGPRWHADLRDTGGYVARHPAGT
jgi:cell wall-associated NlpC family hydrolase